MVRNNGPATNEERNAARTFAARVTVMIGETVHLSELTALTFNPVCANVAYRANCRTGHGQ
eukprot:1683326-Lingulodinium_polyedra.AAC.1